MLNAQARIFGLWRLFHRLFISIKRSAIAGIADGVRGDLKASLQCVASEIVDLEFMQRHDTFGVRLIAVRLKKRCPARAERAVSKQLKAADGEPMMRCIYLRAALEPLLDE